ncbi:4'-phosphopantetheinyl transferase family protein [Microbulbifer litoralis]|uniref:4'-phosphopantetheinyl transferase family protein n=1 Tax=Microbulbifer litoralis TaxID=2933965 RepID=UPI00202848AB|nr:4'-phosphopantetheinyl transferase superfamily protein [Microbulbifer sp. GX H0434]
MFYLTCSDFEGWPDGWRHTSRSWLGIAERKRLAAIRSGARRDQFLAGRLLLRQCLAETLSMAPTDIELAAAAPIRAAQTDGHPLCFVSISHTASCVAVVLSEHPVGVDCERLRARRNWRAISAQFFSAAEAAWLQLQPAEEGLEAFLRSWTLKEALSKCTGADLGQVLARAPLVENRTHWPAEFTGFHAWSGALDNKIQMGLVSSTVLIPHCHYRPGPFDSSGQQSIELAAISPEMC